MKQTYSDLESLPYDIFLNILIQKLNPQDLVNLCSSSDELQAKCDHRDGQVYKLFAQKYLLESNVPYKTILPYLSTEIWDKYTRPIMANGNFRQKYNGKIDFVVPDIIFKAYANKLGIKPEKFLIFFFEGAVGGRAKSPVTFHLSLTINNNKVIGDNMSVSDRYSVDVVDNVPSLIDGKINVLGKLKSHPRFPTNSRYLINGIILPRGLIEIWQNYLRLSELIEPGDSIIFRETSFTVTNDTQNPNRMHMKNVFKVSEDIDLSKYTIGIKYLFTHIWYNDYYFTIRIKSKFDNNELEMKIKGNITVNGEPLW